MTLCYERTQKKSNYWSSPPSRGFLSEKSIFMDELGERVFTLLSSVNHFYWTFFQASSGQGAYTRTHFESDPSSSRQRDSHCGKREQSKGKRGEWRQGEFQLSSSSEDSSLMKSPLLLLSSTPMLLLSSSMPMPPGMDPISCPFLESLIHMLCYDGFGWERVVVDHSSVAKLGCWVWAMSSDLS